MLFPAGEVLALRNHLTSRLTLESLATDFGVPYATVWTVARRERLLMQRDPVDGRLLLTADSRDRLVEAIIRTHNRARAREALADKGVSATSVNAILGSG